MHSRKLIGSKVNTLSPKKPGEPRKLILSGACDVRSASELQSLLLEICNDDQPSFIDCNEVESIDTACIQLLLAAKRDAAEPLTIDFANSEAAKWFELAGVAAYLSNAKAEIPTWLTHEAAEQVK